MKHIWMAIYFCLFTSVTFANNGPIMVTCSDPTNPAASLKLSANLLNNTATIHYVDKDHPHPVIVTIGEVFGIYSHASVTISSFVNDQMWGQKGIKINGTFSNVMRVTTYENFSLTLLENNEGSYVAKQLTYKQGIDAFPDTHRDGSLNLNDMACTIVGL